MVLTLKKIYRSNLLIVLINSHFLLLLVVVILLYWRIETIPQWKTCKNYFVFQQELQ